MSTIATGLGGALTGLCLGAAGLLIYTQVPRLGEHGLLLTFAFIGILYGLVELQIIRVLGISSPWQVPRDWVSSSRWGLVIFGFITGLGFLTKAPFVTFTAFLLWTLLIGSPIIGFLLGAAYGLSRALFAISIPACSKDYSQLVSRVQSIRQGIPTWHRVSGVALMGASATAILLAIVT